MGWTFTNGKYYKENGKVDRKAECDHLFCEDLVKVIKSVMVGNTYYAALKVLDNNSVIGAVVLTSSDRKNGFNFGYKVMTEDHGPVEDKCPVSILKLLTPTDNEYAKGWRDRCWKNSYKKATKKTIVKADSKIMKDIRQLLNRFPDMEKMIGMYEYGIVPLTEVLDKLIELEEKRILSEATWTESFPERSAIK